MWVLQPSSTTYTWLSAKLMTGVDVLGVFGDWVVEADVFVVMVVVGTVVVSVMGTTSTISSVTDTIKA